MANRRAVIFGNSGSGKTSLAKRFAVQTGLAHLDLDSVAWVEADPPARASIDASIAAVDRFMNEHAEWIIEGCYALLIAHAAQSASHLYFLNIGIDTCVSHCRERPWEEDKYPTKEAQDKNLDYLIGWVRSYETRTDEFSLQEHRALFEKFEGAKIEIKSSAEATSVMFPGESAT